jgi:hypothetical protein
VDTSGFYNDNEVKIHKQLNKCYRNKKKLDFKKSEKNISVETQHQYESCITRYNSVIKKIKKRLCDEFLKNNQIRELNSEALNKKNVVAVFESTLTRTIQMPINELSTDIIIVRTYFFDVIKDIILNGFMCNGEKYVCFTASAGQIRTKKTVFIKENLLKKYQNSLTRGLTIEDINRKGGVNVNKYLAYLALCNSATDEWKEFDIRKTIVVDDMETLVTDIVDFIDDEKYEVIRKTMDIPITHTDGCGMILPRKSNKNLMIRLPWVKGLLASFPYDEFIKENSIDKYCGIVKDIYGKEHDILKEDIEIIFTKSQFKMAKYYDSWEHYQENFLKYNCQAGKCNVEEDEFSDAKLNYQMLQTLTDMTYAELENVRKKTKEDISNIGRNRRIMLKVLGVTKANINKNYLQQALEIYPELLNDTYSKEILKQVKKKMVKEARAAKLDIKGKYTFIIPDLYAFCERLFLGVENLEGLPLHLCLTEFHLLRIMV